MYCFIINQFFYFQSEEEDIDQIGFYENDEEINIDAKITKNFNKTEEIQNTNNDDDESSTKIFKFYKNKIKIMQMILNKILKMKKKKNQLKNQTFLKVMIFIIYIKM